MKRLMLIGFAVCAIAVMPTLPTTAMPFAPLTPAVTQADENVMLVKRGGRGHHYDGPGVGDVTSGLRAADIAVGARPA